MRFKNTSLGLYITVEATISYSLALILSSFNCFNSAICRYDSSSSALNMFNVSMSRCIILSWSLSSKNKRKSSINVVVVFIGYSISVYRNEAKNSNPAFDISEAIWVALNVKNKMETTITTIPALRSGFLNVFLFIIRFHYKEKNDVIQSISNFCRKLTYPLFVIII